MSISMDIHPYVVTDINVDSVLGVVNSRLRELLSSLQKEIDIKIMCSLNSIETEEAEVENYQGDLVFSEDKYLQINIEPLGGVICLYCWDVDKYTTTYWQEKIEANEVGHIDTKFVNECVATKKQWQIKREGEQHLFVDVVLGVIASSIATQLSGFVHSTDFAWDPELFPCKGELLFESYLGAGSIKNEEIKDWYMDAVDCIK
jgi:hypothetical protein